MAFISVYFGLGSNVGDRLRNIGTAVRMLDEALGSPHTALSRIIETEAWGFEGADFLNACIRYRIHRKGTPEEHGHELLRICKGIEAALGRQEAVVFDGEGRRVYQNRTMDIDILFYGKERIVSDDLVVPHPLIARRPFVMVPLLEVVRPDLKAVFPEIFVQERAGNADATECNG